MQVLKNKPFHKWQKTEKIGNKALLDVVVAIESGLIDADLGGLLYKQRVATGNRGKSKGARVVVAMKVGARVVFLHGFAKNVADNISQTELRALKKLAKFYMDLPYKEVLKAIKSGILFEVQND